MVVASSPTPRLLLVQGGLVVFFEPCLPINYDLAPKLLRPARYYDHAVMTSVIPGKKSQLNLYLKIPLMRSMTSSSEHRLEFIYENTQSAR